MLSATRQVEGMQISLTSKLFQIRDALHAVLLEVVAELGDRGEGVGRLDGLGVVSDDDGLAGLEGNNTLLALVWL